MYKRQALRLPEMTSVLIGASKVSQLEENIAAVGHSDFTAEELERIKCIPREEYQAFARLTAPAGAVWAQAKRDRNFMAFAPALASIIPVSYTHL